MFYHLPLTPTPLPPLLFGLPASSPAFLLPVPLLPCPTPYLPFRAALPSCIVPRLLPGCARFFYLHLPYLTGLTAYLTDVIRIRTDIRARVSAAAVLGRTRLPAYPPHATVAAHFICHCALPATGAATTRARAASLRFVLPFCGFYRPCHRGRTCPTCLYLWTCMSAEHACRVAHTTPCTFHLPRRTGALLPSHLPCYAIMCLYYIHAHHGALPHTPTTPPLPAYHAPLHWHQHALRDAAAARNAAPHLPHVPPPPPAPYAQQRATHCVYIV